MSERSTGRARVLATPAALRPAACGAGALVSLATTTSVGAVAVGVLLGLAGGTGPRPLDATAWLAGLMPLVLLIASFGGGVVAGGIAGTRASDHGIATWAMTGVAGGALVLIVGSADPALGRLGRTGLPSLDHQVGLVEVVALLCVLLSLAGSIVGATVGVAVVRRARSAVRARP